MRNRASSLIYSTEKSLKEVGDKLDAAMRGEVESALEDLRKQVAKTARSTEIKAATEKLRASLLQDGGDALPEDRRDQRRFGRCR